MLILRVRIKKGGGILPPPPTSAQRVRMLFEEAELWV